MNNRNSIGTIKDSKALKANLLETAGKVEIRQELLVLLEIVDQYKGIHSSLEELLYEVCHPFKNWSILIPQLRSFVLKNSSCYKRHPKGPESFRLFNSIFFAAIAESSKRKTLLSQITEAQVGWVEKMVNLFDGDDLLRFQTALNRLFTDLAALETDEPKALMCIVQGQHPMKRIAERLLKLSENGTLGFDFTPLVRLMQVIFQKNYEYWLSEDDPMEWFLERCGVLCNDFHSESVFKAISHESMHDYLTSLNTIDPASDSFGALANLLELPAHIDIVRYQKEIPSRLANVDEKLDISGHGHELSVSRFAENRKLLYLFRIMDTAGLYLIHEETLREINRSLVQLVRQQSFEEIEEFLLTTFELLKANVRKYPHTSLQCIQVLGGEIFDRGNSRMVETFLWQTVGFGFQYANVLGVDEDWQPITNPSHLANIRVWLSLIMHEPKWCSTLLSALIINIRLTGTCVKDTDLFQRDITELLNHPIEPIYNLTKQFTKLMPVFFNEIGAEGDLRDVSTELDEIHNRQDRLIHFLRKQSHVESSNLIVDFIQAILLFWKTGKKELLRSFLPDEVYSEIEAKGPYFDEQHALAERISKQLGFASMRDILEWDNDKRKAFLDRQADISEVERNRFELLVKMYKLLYQKYNLGFQELRIELLQAKRAGFPEMEKLLEKLESCQTEVCLKALLITLEGLKKNILSKERFEAKEDIYYKRHIAVDIPSVYGRYRELKFDSLSLTFRLENLANLYFERLPEIVNLSFITQATFYRIVKCLKLYMRALDIDGITSRRLEIYLSLLVSSLKMRRFSYTQYLDIFRGLSEGVKDIIYAFYTNTHQNNLSIIIPQVKQEYLLTKYRSQIRMASKSNRVHMLSEAFLRDLIASTFGLQHLDNFIVRIIQTLERQKDLLDEDKLDLLMTYNPEKAVSLLHKSNPYTRDLIHLGNKGYNLMTLTRDKIKVPPAFIITTEVFRCWPVIKEFSTAREEFMRRIRDALTDIEKLTGKVFGSPEKPLLLSVRSGAAISMPGMMATIHNVGLNEDLIDECLKSGGNEYLSWDNYRRFLQSWAMTFGMDREDFQMLMDEAKAEHEVDFKSQFTPSQMRKLALSYRRLILDRGLEVPEDPWLQLVSAVDKVLGSWKSTKSLDYRKIMDLSESWGTAVTVQEMVFGNRSDQAGSGVLFTSHPYRKVRRVALWGDYAYGDQGEDIVSGLVVSCPISVEQAEIDGRSVDETLERRFPEIYESLLAISRELVYEKLWNPQEIEFTFEGPKAENLYLLQTRDMITIKKKERLNVFVESKKVEKSLLGRGVGVSGSALSGLAVFTTQNILDLRMEDPEAPLILIRQDTVPEDIIDIDLADGLLTSRGGQTSHASVVAVRLEKTCVVGCKDLKVYESKEYCEINGSRINFGDPISIDGRNGLFVEGDHPIQREMHILPI